jgi:hypothetical protein
MSRLAAEIEKLHLALSGEGERKRCKETVSTLRRRPRITVTEEQANENGTECDCHVGSYRRNRRVGPRRDLTGLYRCVAGCLSGRPGLAFVTQNGWELNLVNEVGEPSRGWVDYPGRLWIARANLGAIYSPDGMTIQFDNGTIWQRAPEAPPPPPPRRRR